MFLVVIDEVDEVLCVHLSQGLPVESDGRLFGLKNSLFVWRSSLPSVRNLASALLADVVFTARLFSFGLLFLPFLHVS